MSRLRVRFNRMLRVTEQSSKACYLDASLQGVMGESRVLVEATVMISSLAGSVLGDKVL